MTRSMIGVVAALLLGASVGVAQDAPAAAVAANAAAAAPFRVERTGSGRAMLLIPGFLSSGEVWQGTVERFRGEYDMHVLTLAGFAGVPPTGADPYLASTRDAIIAYIREQRLERPVLVGHSLGAFLALWVAATAPDLVGPVIAVDGVPFLMALADTTMTEERAASQAQGVRAVFGSLTREALGAQTRMAFAAQVRDTAWLAIGERWGAASDAATAGRAVAEMMTTDLRDDVARIRTPVLTFLAGYGLSPEQREAVAARYRGQLARVPDARVVIAEQARHFVMLDDPEFFQRTVAAFLEGR